MESLMIKSRSSLQHLVQTLNASTLGPPGGSSPATPPAPSPAGGAAEDPLSGESERSPPADPTMGRNHSLPAVTATVKPSDDSFTTGDTSDFTYSDNSTGEYFPNYWANSDDPLSWNSSYLNSTNVTGYNASDYELSNASNSSVQYGFWFCTKWVDAQQDLFQAANLCLAAAFLVPKSFKQSILLVRALAAAGFLLLAVWAAMELCAPDVLAWNITLVIINSIHTVLLVIRFLPPALSLELTELYLRVFKPLKVSKKHFRELTREARLLRLAPGEPYAVEGVTPADERLSILLKGKMKVTCEQTNLHMISPQQFVDSPEWEANHEQSDDVFQVTIVAEENCTYLCWPRMRLERVLRHRPMLKIVLDSLIGKDITHKLYSLNEQQLTAASDIAATAASLVRPLPRSLSADAVHVGARGRVRSFGWTAREKRTGITEKYSPLTSQQQQWRPVASQFPQSSPFSVRRPVSASRPPLASQSSSASLPGAPLLSPPRRTFRKTASFRRNREVKFAEPHEAGS